MTDPSTPRDPRCPTCGAPLPSPLPAACPACGLKTGEQDAPKADPYAPPPEPLPSEENPFAAPRGLTEQRLISAGAWVGASIVGGLLVLAWYEEPFLGFSLSLLAVPAVARTLVIDARSREPLGLGSLTGHFLYALLMTFLAEVAVSVAFFATCFPTGLVTVNGPGGAGILFAVGVGLVAAGFMAYKVAWLFRIDGGEKRS